MIQLLTYFAQRIDESDLDIPTTTPTPGTVETGLNILIGIAASIALLIIAISAFRIVISRGNSQDVQKARDAIIYASVGLIITMMAFAIVTFVVDNV